MSVFVRQNAIAMEYTKDAWAILNPIEQSIKAKIEKYGTPLKDWDVSIYRGVLTGCNEAFIISGEKRKELIAEDPKSDEIIRPILRGRDIKRYGYEFADLWLIATFPSKHYDIDDYPAVKKWLQSFGKKLEQTGEEYIDSNGTKQKCRKKTNNKWFETQDSIAYWNDFSKQKIVWSETAQEMKFSIVEGQYMTDKTTFILISEYENYLTALCNSKIIEYYVRITASLLGNKGISCSKIFMENIPAILPKQLHNTTYEKIISLVKQISSAYKDNKKHNLHENELNDIFYDEYQLTSEEKSFIDSYLMQFQ